MRSLRRTPDPRSAEQILASPAALRLLGAVAAGEIRRGDGGDESAMAPHMWGEHLVRWELRRLADDDLVRVPMSGPPKLTDYGAKILARGRTEPS